MIAIALLLAAVGIATLIYMPRLEAQILAVVPEPQPGTEISPLFYLAVVVVAAVVVGGVLYGAARTRGER